LGCREYIFRLFLVIGDDNLDANLVGYYFIIFFKMTEEDNLDEVSGAYFLSLFIINRCE
jgi:hypothetical protein